MPSPTSFWFLCFLEISLHLTAYSAPMSFTDCGNKETSSIYLEPCPSRPCHFDKGEVANLTITFVARKPVKQLSVHCKLRTGGLWDYEMDLTPEDNQICKNGNPGRDVGKLDCPLQVGTKYTYYFTKPFPVSTSFNIFRYARVTLTNEYGENVMCGDILLEFQRFFNPETENEFKLWPE